MILQGDCREVLRSLPESSIHCVVTSPPYYGLRDYGTGKWEGGDEGCDHKNTTRHQSPGTTSVRGDRANVEAQKSQNFRKTCKKCGATRIDLQIGLEADYSEYIEELVATFQEMRRVLRDDGIVWLNLGDSYATGAGGVGERPGGGPQGDNWKGEMTSPNRMPQPGLKPKDLMMIPARVAIALQADGWWIRKDIIWFKPNPMPESATDRPTSAHEHIFLLTKSGSSTFWTHRDRRGSQGIAPEPDYRWVHRETNEEIDVVPPDAIAWRRINLWESHDYFFDGEAVREAGESGPSDQRKMAEGLDRIGGKHKTLDDPFARASATTNMGRKRSVGEPGTRNVRDVWTIPTVPFPDAHFACFPPEIAERCIRAGTSERGCCAKCGAPHFRIIIKGEPDIDHQRASGGDLAGTYRGQSTKGHDAAGVQNASDVKRRILEGMRQKTYRWEPTCTCGAEVVPCTVLDPFGGSGTTGLVADRLGRNAILIELNPEYVEMARRRVTGDSPLFADVR